MNWEILLQVFVLCGLIAGVIFGYGKITQRVGNIEKDQEDLKEDSEKREEKNEKALSEQKKEFHYLLNSKAEAEQKLNTEIQVVREQLKEYVVEQVKTAERQLADHAQITELKKEFSEFKREVEGIKETTSEIKQDIASIKPTLKQLMSLSEGIMKKLMNN